MIDLDTVKEARCGIKVSEDRARYTRAHEGLGLGEWLEQGSQPYQAEIELHICAPSAH